MRETRIIMGMPVTVEIAVGTVEKDAGKNHIDFKSVMDEVFDYFVSVDEKFSTYKETSEISAINAGKLESADYSEVMKEIFLLSEKTKSETAGYFDIVNRQGKYDPSGIVKGWAIWNAGKILHRRGVENFFVDAGGDVQTAGLKSSDKDGKGGAWSAWSVGIADPFAKNYGGTAMTGAPSTVVKVIRVSGGEGVATSGTAIRGQHIYNPHKKSTDNGIYDIVSLTVIGPNIYEADRFATAAFAMGRRGIEFIENIRLDAGKKLEGYMIDKDGIAVMTSGFEKYVIYE
jgi:thiamine biosynthesis lipoprotein